MTTLEIIVLVLISVGTAVAVGFLIAGFVEMYVERGVKLPRRGRAVEEPVIEPAIVEEEVSEPEIDIDQMLARLEARKEEVENTEIVEEPVEEIVEEPVIVEEIEEPTIVEEVIEEPVVDEVEEIEEVEEEIVVEEPEKEKVTATEEVDNFDYKTRLEKIKESQEKIEKDLEKTQKAINKYERTERRRARNQKLLDKKATELTNLNLVMYSVTDIKNVDAEKKAKQEELTTHIAELKASIQDAEEDLAKNESKYQNNIKLLAYLKHEKHRYEEEVKEIEKMLDKAGK